MRFIVDGMLGKLTRWLRMLGHDVKYSNKFKDNQLINLAKSEERVLLTKDLKLYQQATAKRAKIYYVKGEKEKEKLGELAEKFNIQLYMDMSKSRCPKCNTRIETVSKKEVSERVGRKTFKYYSKFWECPNCKQVYWKGSHWKGIRETLQKARERITSD